MAPFHVFLICAATISFLFLGNLSAASSIFPGEPYWTDTDGVPIQAHGGGFLYLNQTYYWFGEDKTLGGHLFHYVNCYASADLVNWRFLGHSLTAEDDPSSELSSEAVVERPKVIYNQRTNKFVMWFHLDSSNYGLAKLGVAISDKVEGPYTYLGSIAPFREDSRDMTVWVDEEDPEKTAYLVYATRVNLDTVIARLSRDYLEVEQRLLKLEGIHREAYAVFRTNNLYYIVMSRATGWDPNSNEYMYSSNMSGPWSDRFVLAPGSSNTYESQANYVIPVANGQFIYAGDRWNRYDLSDSRYVWLPIQFAPEGNSISIHWSSQYSVDVTIGNMTNSSSNHYDINSPEADLIGNATVVPCSGCENGEAVGYIGYGGKFVLKGISGGQNGGLHSVLISYANGDSSWRYASLRVTKAGAYTNGPRETISEKVVTFPRTGGGQITKQIVVQIQLDAGQVNDLEISNESGYGPDIDYLRVECILD